MIAKIAPEQNGECAVILKSGQSFNVFASDLPSALSKGGDAELAFVPVGELSSNNQAKDLLNYLLKIE
ncbi:MAG: hypothetical protein CO042_02465 [Parcubacteria group bacterium CG_4_9_14_0_2_um_filter_41_8]|nr:MAG: hypothetical protein AUJ34_02720 [Parcubacteria group bacterium CG1_02_41_12]PIQ79537.1 MAG: hypothetical protein COV79_03455 [Parcubacteria group bacterium CG11_big_fil_rev_8_21_14_0_20_41_14]PJC40697.1 MAG: hypothetical protein CO042_02465 [Parcubacteria group bacterium CG_4_9_14_0_2_um_filter_41_8]